MDFTDLIAQIKYRDRLFGEPAKSNLNQEKTVKIPKASELHQNHQMNREKLFEVYGLIEQLVKNDKGERIVQLCRYLDEIVKDYSQSMVSTHAPLIDLFKLLIDKNIKGEKLLRIIRDRFNGDAVMFARGIKHSINDYLLSPEEIKQRADESLRKCLEVI